MTFKAQTLLLLVPLTLSACGGGSDEPSPENTNVSSAAEEAAAEKAAEEAAEEKASSGACIDEQYTIVSAMDDGTYNEGEDPGNAIDNSTTATSRWSSQSTVESLEKEIIFDLGEEKSLSALQLFWHKGNERTSDFHIETSNDLVTWQRELEDQQSTKLTELGFEVVNLPSTVNTQYFKLIGLGNSEGSGWNSLVEAQAFSCALTETVAPVQKEIDYTVHYDSDDALPCDEKDQILYNGVCADYTVVYEEEHGVLDEGAYLTSSEPLEMTFDALAAQHVTSNGNGWRHELKIKSSGGYRVGMTEVYELFKAKITVELDPGAKTIVAQHHASDTGTITKLYVADLDEGGFDAAADGTESNSIAMDGLFDVYIRLAELDEDGQPFESKHLLAVIESGDSFDFALENNHGTIVTEFNGEKLSPTVIEDSTESYFKFGNYQQAQYPVDAGDIEIGDKLTSGDKDGDWAEFYAEYFSTSKITFSEMSYIRTVD